MKMIAQSLKCITLCLLVTAMMGCAPTPTKKSTGEYIDDAAITAKVKSALIADPNVSGLAVNVDTFKGEVLLSGFVNSAAQAQKAGEIASKVSGVKSVKNNLVVKPGT